MSEMERVQREGQLVRGDCVRVEGHGRFGKVNGVLLRSTMEPGDDVSGKFGCDLKPLPEFGSQRGY